MVESPARHESPACRESIVEIIAHRGASDEAPENTLSSIRLAWQQGADAVEIDCRLTADGQIVVIHDADTRRVAGRRLVVAQSTFDELRRLEYGAWKGATWTGEPIPTLSEAIATIEPGKRLFIEVKCGDEIASALCATLRDSGRPLAEFVLISYFDAVLTAAKQSLPGLTTYLVARLIRLTGEADISATIRRLIARALALGLDGLDLETDPELDAQQIARIEQAGLACYVWTVDAVDEAVRLQAAGAAGITTNRPGWLREQLAKV